jgi:hypothetical protein
MYGVEHQTIRPLVGIANPVAGGNGGVLEFIITLLFGEVSREPVHPSVKTESSRSGNEDHIRHEKTRRDRVDGGIVCIRTPVNTPNLRDYMKEHVSNHHQQRSTRTFTSVTDTFDLELLWGQATRSSYVRCDLTRDGVTFRTLPRANRLTS